MYRDFALGRVAYPATFGLPQPANSKPRRCLLIPRLRRYSQAATGLQLGTTERYTDVGTPCHIHQQLLPICIQPHLFEQNPAYITITCRTTSHTNQRSNSLSITGGLVRLYHFRITATLHHRTMESHHWGFVSKKGIHSLLFLPECKKTTSQPLRDADTSTPTTNFRARVSGHSYTIPATHIDD